MVLESEMTEQERCLYSRCVRSMMEVVEGWLDYTPGRLTRNRQEIPLPVPFFFHFHLSALELYAQCLEELGLLLPLVDPPSRACCFAMAFSPAEAEAIAYERAPAGPPLKRLLASLLYFAEDKVGMHVAIGIEFPADCYVKFIMPDMCDLGFAARTENGYIWLPRFRDVLAAGEDWWFPPYPVFD